MPRLHYICKFETNRVIQDYLVAAGYTWERSRLLCDFLRFVTIMDADRSTNIKRHIFTNCKPGNVTPIALFAQIIRFETANIRVSALFPWFLSLSMIIFLINFCHAFYLLRKITKRRFIFRHVALSLFRR